jgi:SAM-dependent methyltransferase
MLDQALSFLARRAPSLFTATQRTHDWVWDMRHGVETRQYVDRLTVDGNAYQPVNPRRLNQLLNMVPHPLEAATFVDVGSGKGRAVLVAAGRPFKAVCGVEYSPDLHQLAHQNMRRFRGNIRAKSMFCVHCDARSFEWPLTPLVVLFFNPFPLSVMSPVVERLHRSLAAQPRAASILCTGQYTARAPFEQGWPGLRCIQSTPATAVYFHEAITDRARGQGDEGDDWRTPAAARP